MKGRDQEDVVRNNYTGWGLGRRRLHVWRGHTSNTTMRCANTVVCIGFLPLLFQCCTRRGIIRTTFVCPPCNSVQSLEAPVVKVWIPEAHVPGSPIHSFSLLTTTNSHIP